MCRFEQRVVVVDNNSTTTTTMIRNESGSFSLVGRSAPPRAYPATTGLFTTVSIFTDD
jgi:hypothetical protein